MDKLEYIPGDLVFANGKLCEVVGDSCLGSDFIDVIEYVHGSFDNNVSIIVSKKTRCTLDSFNRGNP